MTLRETTMMKVMLFVTHLRRQKGEPCNSQVKQSGPRAAADGENPNLVRSPLRVQAEALCAPPEVAAYMSPETQRIMSMITEPDNDVFSRTHGDSKRVSSKQHVQNVASSSKDHPLVAGREAELAPSGRNLGSGGSPSRTWKQLLK